MKNKIIELYNEDLLMIFEESKLKDDYKYLAVIRSGAEKKELDGVLTLNYDEDFESHLNYRIPSKTRKQAKLLSYAKTMEMLERIKYATIGCIIDGMPYTYALNYVMIDGHMYFHTGRKGYKLKALGTKASVNVVEDLGIAYNGTHNFRSAQIYGTLTPTEDYELKKKILLKLISHVNPAHPAYVDEMQKSTLVFEIDVDYMMGRENLYLPGDGK